MDASCWGDAFEQDTAAKSCSHLLLLLFAVWADTDGNPLPTHEFENPLAANSVLSRMVRSTRNLVNAVRHQWTWGHLTSTGQHHRTIEKVLLFIVLSGVTSLLSGGDLALSGTTSRYIDLTHYYRNNPIKLIFRIVTINRCIYWKKWHLLKIFRSYSRYFLGRGS